MVKIDIEMPKSCGQCPCVAIGESMGYEYLMCPILCDKDVDFYENEQEGRHPDCKLIEIEKGE